MEKNVKGKLITNDVTLQPHELATVEFLVGRYGKMISLIVPSYTPHNRNPDFMMDGVLWEMKSPQGRESRTLERAFKNAAKQSKNIVIDLRRMTLDTRSALRLLGKRFNLSRHVKRLRIITKEEKVVDFRKSRARMKITKGDLRSHVHQAEPF